MRFFLPLLALALACSGCGRKTEAVDPLTTTSVTLPNGRRIVAEVKIQPVEIMTGMMFRESLPAGRGMLFVYGTPDYHAYWMYQCRIPLDIIWMDSGRQIVEISEHTPPCETPASQCPRYGGNRLSQYVLELGAGEAARNGLRVGQTLAF